MDTWAVASYLPLAANLAEGLDQDVFQAHLVSDSRWNVAVIASNTSCNHTISWQEFYVRIQRQTKIEELFSEEGKEGCKQGFSMQVLELSRSHRIQD